MSKLLALALVSICLGTPALVRAASLVGYEVTVTAYFPDFGRPITLPNTQLVGPGIEFPDGSLTLTEAAGPTEVVRST